MLQRQDDLVTAPMLEWRHSARPRFQYPVLQASRRIEEMCQQFGIFGHRQQFIGFVTARITQRKATFNIHQIEQTQITCGRNHITMVVVHIVRQAGRESDNPFYDISTSGLYRHNRVRTKIFDGFLQAGLHSVRMADPHSTSFCIWTLSDSISTQITDCVPIPDSKILPKRPSDPQKEPHQGTGRRRPSRAESQASDDRSAHHQAKKW